MCVIKLGGSLAFSPLLRPWLRAISAARGEVVIVPGGGAFADAVRAAQPGMGFDDRAAHLMAVHAMGQFGIALASIGADCGLVLAAQPAEIERALAGRKIPVWSPLATLRDAPEVAQSWSVTSDSLALWLAGKLDARSLVLVKPRPAPAGKGVSELVTEGLVDPAFPDFLARYSGAVFLAGPDDLPSSGLDARHPPGVALRAVG